MTVTLTVMPRPSDRSPSSGGGRRSPAGCWPPRPPPPRTPPCSPPPTCSSSAPTTSWPPTPTTSPVPRPAGQTATVIDRLRLDHRPGSRRWPQGSATWPPCPTRSARSPTAGSGPTASGSSGSGCRSAWWRSSTRTGPTSPPTPSACASSRATPPSCGGPRAPSRPTSPSPPRCARALSKAGLPEDALVLVEDTSHEAAVEFMQLRDCIDVLIPRGGPSLIASILEHATVPYVIDGDGNCHVYVDARADLDDGPAHRRERQDPATVGVQRRRDPPRAPGGGRAVPRRPGAAPRRRRAARRRPRPCAAPRCASGPPTTTGAPSSST